MLPRRQLTSELRVGEWYYQSYVGVENSAEYQLEKSERVRRLLDAASTSQPQYSPITEPTNILPKPKKVTYRKLSLE